MTITLEIRPEIEAELARQASSLGMGVDAYAASLLEEAVHLPPVPQAVAEGCERLKNFGKTHGLSLGGMTIRKLRDEARP
jgi:hypothetical protein